MEAHDVFPFAAQVFIPPFGTTKFELITEQLLQQHRGEIAFEVPFIPHEEVGCLIFDLSVVDLQGNPTDFYLELDLPGVDANGPDGTNKFHLEFNHAGQYDLPIVD